MCGALGAAIRIQCPINPIFGKTVPKDGAGMIEDDGVGLAFGGTQYSPDHLAIEAHLLCRPRQNAATDFGRIPAFSQHQIICNEFDFTVCQPLERYIALQLWCCGINVLGANAGPHELSRK